MPIVVVIAVLFILVLINILWLDTEPFSSICLVVNLSIIVWINVAAFQDNNYKFEYIDTINILQTDEGLSRVAVIDQDKIIDLTDTGINELIISKFRVRKQIELCSGGINWMNPPKYTLVKKETVE